MAIREINKNGKLVWVVDLTNRELKQRVRKTFSDKLAAKKYHADVEFAFSKHQPLPRLSGNEDISTNTKGYTVEKCFNICFEHEWKGGKSESKMQQKGKAIMAYFGKHELISNITTARINQWKLDMRNGKTKEDGFRLANSTINRNLACLSKMLRFALHEDKLNKMPVIKREKENNTRIRWITEVEEKLILDRLRKNAAPDNNCLDVLHGYIVAVDTGIRASELLRLQKKDILKNGMLYIGESKNGHSRSVPLYDRTKRVLDIRSKTIEGDFLFPYQDSWYRQEWEKVLRHLGLDEDVVWHTLRHTCASRLAQWGEQIVHIKEWLGHKAIQTTMRYSHLSPVTLQETANRLSARVDAIDDAVTQM